jgi:hypothetical protein
MIMSELLTVAMVSFLAGSALHPANNDMAASRVISLNLVMSHILQKGGNDSLSPALSLSAGHCRDWKISQVRHEAEDVRARIYLLPARLLRRHMARLPIVGTKVIFTDDDKMTETLSAN